MENNIDKVFRETIKRSAEFYDPIAENVKHKIWSQVQIKDNVSPWIIHYRSLVAACLLLLLTTSVMSIAFMRSRTQIRSLTEANNKLKKNNTYYLSMESGQKNIAVANRISDTVYIETKTIVQKLDIITQRDTDTIFLNKPIFVEKESAPLKESVVGNKPQTDTVIRIEAREHETNFLISNNEMVKQDKGKKIRIRFGGNNYQNSNGILALTTKL